MNSREKESLDRYITGNHGEDQLKYYPTECQICGKPIVSFRNQKSLDEFLISGTCQICQDIPIKKTTQEGDKPVSIKNPYHATYSKFLSHPLTAYENGLSKGFNEGVKAANEDWIEWGDKISGACRLQEDDDRTCNACVNSGECYIEKWVVRKKEIKQ